MLELTNRAMAATSLPMQDVPIRKRGSVRAVLDNRTVASTGLGRAGKVMLMCGMMALGGCVSVNAPDKPIVIELNINIEQKVIYQLAADAANTIQENPGIF